TSVCGIPDVVKDGVTGILVPSGDINGLANAMLKLVRDPALRKKMGEEGRKRARMFGVEEMVGKIDALYAGYRMPVAGCQMPDAG
ncbi:MAG: glycosyltransferase, partial [bacterium]|nr:glycosyltransferase [bacterium]